MPTPTPYPVPTIQPVYPPTNIYLGSPTGISAYADAQTDAAHTYLLQLGVLTASLAPPTITPEFPSGPSAPPQITADPPELQTIVWVSPDPPASFTETLNVDDILPDPFDDNPPTLSFPAAPTAFSELAPTSPGVNLVFEDPALDVQLPAVPELLALNVLTFEGLNLPTIDPDAIPTLNVVEPTLREYTPGAAYTSSLLTAVKTSLEDTIVNGGTGLNP
jgi:hypothetical protein